jgi:hypothetical protein
MQTARRRPEWFLLHSVRGILKTAACDRPGGESYEKPPWPLIPIGNCCTEPVPHRPLRTTGGAKQQCRELESEHSHPPHIAARMLAIRFHMAGYPARASPSATVCCCAIFPAAGPGSGTCSQRPVPFRHRFGKRRTRS